ncbi:hypothetical protein SAMN04488483_5329 [Pseudomonas helmanticensis]|uniref:Uncharacterized protein n=1 Tax=Pseudomonas helmanticensis TaxID=1471381 RepID=A0ACD2UDE0_9PSED|nr:hypothetical protein [Pseudomonas helmanticensis]SMQ30280.1 hypothetical protein SAMN04488483_5329 [Pseudomonas helmanticensis]
MNRKILSGLALFVIAIYVMNTRTHLPQETQRPNVAYENALPFGSVHAVNAVARTPSRGITVKVAEQVNVDGFNDGGATSARYPSEHWRRQGSSTFVKYKAGGIGSDEVAMSK